MDCVDIICCGGVCNAKTNGGLNTYLALQAICTALNTHLALQSH
jgi:hypothetical protein